MTLHGPDALVDDLAERVVAYIDHLDDEAKLVQPEFRARVGDAIRDGVVRYYQSP